MIENWRPIGLSGRMALITGASRSRENGTMVTPKAQELPIKDSHILSGW